VRRALTENAALAGRNVVRVVRPSLRYTKNPSPRAQNMSAGMHPALRSLQGRAVDPRLAEHGNGIAQKDNGFHTSAKSSAKEVETAR
jgi:hypothetical protein